MLKKLILLIMAMSLFGLFAGCGEDGASSSDEELAAIADEFGGYTPTDEAAAFGDPDLIADIDADGAYDDDLLKVAEVASVMEESEEGTYALRIIWGSLEYDPEITEVTDWSGSLTVSRGAEIVRRVIRFEDATDYIVERTDRSLIEWVSMTTVHNDGIAVNLYIPPIEIDDLTDKADDPVTVTFETGPLSVTFDISEIPALDTIYYLEDSVNAVSFRGFKIDPMGCPNGFLEGKWGLDETDQGIFNGRWIASNGSLAGFVEGTWGTDESTGENVFVGKYIDINGQFEGLLKGTYRWMPFGVINGNPQGNIYRHGGGQFYGRIYDAETNPIGVVKGRFRMPRDDAEDAMGWFFGRWKTFCSSISNVDDGMDEQ